LEFRPQIAKKAMPPKPPQDIRKTPSSGSKRPVSVIEVDDDAEMEQSSFVDITSRPRHKQRTELLRLDQHLRQDVVCLSFNGENR